MDRSTRSGTQHRWWHGAVLYRMSVRSWLDTGQDGYGDLLTAPSDRPGPAGPAGGGPGRR